MIRVLHVADKLSIAGTSIHGVTRLLSWWLPSFDKEQFDVKVCTFRGRDSAGDYLEKQGVEVFYLNKGKFNPLILFGLAQLIKKEQIDVLHLHGYGAWTFGRIAGKYCGVPSIVHEHMVDRNIPIYQRIADKILSKLTAHAIAISISVKDFMTQYRYINEPLVDVIVNGIPLENFGEQFQNIPSGIEDIYRKRFNIPNDHIIIGTVGRLDANKGHRNFLQAAQEVLKGFKDVIFLIVGDGEQRESLEAQARELNLKQHVRFTGHCDHIAPLYAMMDIVIIASFSEGGPLTLFEAMASNCAVIATDTIGLKDIIAKGKFGYLVPAADAKGMAECMSLLLSDKNLLHEMKDSAKQAAAPFDLANTVSKIENCYKKTLAQ